MDLLYNETEFMCKNVETNLVNISMTNDLLKHLSKQNSKSGKLYSFTVIHIAGSFTILLAGAADSLIQLAAGVVKSVTGFFVSPLNFFASPFTEKRLAQNWGWTMAANHLTEASRHFFCLVPISIITLLSKPEVAREIFFKDKISSDERDLMKTSFITSVAQKDNENLQLKQNLDDAKQQIADLQKQLLAAKQLPKPDENANKIVQPKREPVGLKVNSSEQGGEANSKLQAQANKVKKVQVKIAKPQSNDKGKEKEVIPSKNRPQIDPKQALLEDIRAQKNKKPSEVCGNIDQKTAQNQLEKEIISTCKNQNLLDSKKRFKSFVDELRGQLAFADEGEDFSFEKTAECEHFEALFNSIQSFIKNDSTQIDFVAKTLKQMKKMMKEDLAANAKANKKHLDEVHAHEQRIQAANRQQDEAIFQKQQKEWLMHLPAAQFIGLPEIKGRALARSLDQETFLREAERSKEEDLKFKDFDIREILEAFIDFKASIESAENIEELEKLNSQYQFWQKNFVNLLPAGYDRQVYSGNE